MNSKIGIIVGEDADLPASFIKKNNIIIFPFVIDWDRFTKGENIYKQMRSVSTKGPRTSQPAVSTFAKIFSDALTKFDELLVITVSSKFSGTNNAAVQARKKIGQNKRIHIFDSETSSGAEGLLVARACNLIKFPVYINKVIEDLATYKKNINLLGVFDDPKWLVAGGRISKIKGVIVANMLKGGFRPVLTIKDGEIVVKKIQINARDRVEALAAQFEEETTKNGSYEVVITHADCVNDAKKLEKLIEKSEKSVKINYVHEISPVVGCHLGPDTLLLSWAAN